MIQPSSPSPNHQHNSNEPYYISTRPIDSNSRDALKHNRHSNNAYTDIKSYDDASYRSVRTLGHRMFGCFGPKFALSRSQKIILLCSLIALVMVSTIVLLLLIYISQLISFIINKSSFEVQLSKLSKIESDSFNLVFSSNVYRTGPVVATLSPSVMFLIDEEGTEIGQFSIPTQTLDGSWGSTPAMSLDTNFEIINDYKFSLFMIRVINEKVIPWRLISDFNISLNLLPGHEYPIHMDKVIYMPGLNSFSGQQIIFFDLPDESESGIIVKVKTKFFNASPIAMIAGAAGFKMYYREVFIGNLHLSAMNLIPGDNEWVLSGNLGKLSTQEMEIVNSFFNDFIKGKESNIKVVGEYINPSIDSSTSIPWLQNAFSNLVMSLDMPGIKDFNPISSIDVLSMFIDFSSPLSTNFSNCTFPITVDIVAKYSLPFGFPVKILELSQEIGLLDGDNRSIVASASFPSTPVLCDVFHREIIGKINGTISISEASFNPMVAFLNTIISGKLFSFVMDGKAISKMASAQGVMTLSNLTISQQLDMRGMNSLRDPPPSIKSIRVLKANSEDGIFKEIDLELINPSPVGSNLGKVDLDLYYQDTFIGISVINSLILTPGINLLKAYGLLTLPPNTPLMEEFLSQYILGKVIPLEMRGSQSSSNIPLLSGPLSSLITSTTIKGIQTPLVEYCKLSRSFTGKLFAKFRVVNPMDVPVTLTGLTNFSVYFGEQADSFDLAFKINSLEMPVLEKPTIIPPKSSVMLTEWIPLQAKASFALEKQIGIELALHLYFLASTNGYLHLLIDEYPVKLYYEQTGLRVYFGFV